jgi:flagellar hook-associated protein 1 FlgK
MASLFSSLSVAERALLANQAAIGVTSNNVANLNTPGYTRQRPVLEEGAPWVLGPLVVGSGVEFKQPQSLRDDILELRVQEEKQQQSKAGGLLSSLQPVEAMFTSSEGDLGSKIDALFTAFNDLSASPSSLPLRQAVLTAAGNLASSFRTTSGNLVAQRQNLNLNVEQSVGQINQLTSRIAKINLQISALENAGQNASVLVDQRTQMISDLSGLVDVRVIPNESSISLTTANGTALVATGESFKLTTSLAADGMQHIFAQGQDITATLTGGELAGQLEVRDQKIPDLLGQLDALASGLTTALNTAHRAGSDLSGTPGGDFFVPSPAGGAGAAGAMQVAVTDPAKLAASSDGSSGSNGNVSNLLAVGQQAVASGQKATEFYASLVFGLGSSVANAQSESEASNAILQQLQEQRGSVSGVSLDEEAANMVRFQQAFEAAARVVTTISEMLNTVIQMGA